VGSVAGAAAVMFAAAVAAAADAAVTAAAASAAVAAVVGSGVSRNSLRRIRLPIIDGRVGRGASGAGVPVESASSELDKLWTPAWMLPGMPAVSAILPSCSCSISSSSLSDRSPVGSIFRSFSDNSLKGRGVWHMLPVSVVSSMSQ